MGEINYTALYHQYLLKNILILGVGVNKILNGRQNRDQISDREIDA